MIILNKLGGYFVKKILKINFLLNIIYCFSIFNIFNLNYKNMSNNINNKNVLIFGIDGLDNRALNNRLWFKNLSKLRYRKQFAIPTYESLHGWTSIIYGKDFKNIDKDLKSTDSSFFQTIYKNHPQIKQTAIIDWPVILNKIINKNHNFINKKLTNYYTKYYPINKRLATKATQETVDILKQTIHNSDNQLIFTNFEEIDETGHAGDLYNSEYLINLYKFIDKKINEICNEIKKRIKIFKEDWLIIVTTDHGRNELDSTNHSKNDQNAQRSFIYANKNLKKYNNQKDADSLFDLKNIINNYYNS